MSTPPFGRPAEQGRVVRIPPRPHRAPDRAPQSGSGAAAEPPAKAATASPWAAIPQQTRAPATSRLRRVVEALPSWEPLPPGESLVRRPSGDR